MTLYLVLKAQANDEAAKTSARKVCRDLPESYTGPLRETSSNWSVGLTICLEFSKDKRKIEYENF